MKTTTKYILTAMFFLTGLVSFAMIPEFSGHKTDSKKESVTIVKFTVPSETGENISVEFEVPVPVDACVMPNVDLSALKGLVNLTFSEAEFDEAADETTNDFTALAPATPSEATFEDALLTDVDLSVLAPVTPAEATFEDATEADVNPAALAPVTPSEATFEDAPESDTELTALAPSAPKEATFDDAPETTTDLTTLAPVTPAEATFDDAPETTTGMTTIAPSSPAEADYRK